MNAKDTLQLKDNPFRLQMLWTPLLSPVQKEQIVYIFKKKTHSCPCTEWGHLTGFCQGTPAGWRSFLRVSREPVFVCRLTRNSHEAAVHQTAVISPRWERRSWCIRCQPRQVLGEQIRPFKGGGMQSCNLSQDLVTLTCSCCIQKYNIYIYFFFFSPSKQALFISTASFTAFSYHFGSWV